MKKREIIGGLMATLAFLWIVGTAGALECENITMSQAAVQGVIGVVAGWIGLKLLGAEFN